MSLARPLVSSVWSSQLRAKARLVDPIWSRNLWEGQPQWRPWKCVECRTQSIKTASRLYSTNEPPKTHSSDISDGKSAHQTGAAAHELPSTSESRRSQMNQKFSYLMDNLQMRVLTASQTLNDITGYSAIEQIKKRNAELEADLAKAHIKVHAARQAYKTSNTKRTTSQREVTTLLARKDSWSPQDLERFTELYRTDHVIEGEVARAQSDLTEAEAEEQSLGQKLNAGILNRYHEEQIWSDRIRRASTWGTWGLMGMNFLLFVVLQFVAEPWRRRRLVRGVVAEEKAVLAEVRSELEAVKAALERRPEQPDLQREQQPTDKPTSSSSSRPAPTATVGWREGVKDRSGWMAFVADLASERRIDLRMVDASILALQGAVAGAAIAGSIIICFSRTR